MDSDDEDDFRIDEVENVRTNLVFQPGGKLSDIMAEVEIPSIDFDDNFDDDSDNTQFHDEPVHVYEHYHAFPSDDDLKDTNIFPNEDPSTVSSEPSQTDNTYSKENNDTSPNTDDAKDHSDQLNFEKLNEINFYAVESTLSNFGSSEKSLSMYDMVCSESNEEILSETELMTRLSDLSKDQLKACCSVAVDRSEKTKEVKSNFPYQQKEHSAKASGDNVSTKAIHSWPQLKKEGHTLSLQPSTVFLDLRPEAATEKEMAETEHTASIQRILGLKEQRSATSSEDDSDDDLNNWYQMRSKHKQNVCKEKESYGNKSVGRYHNIGTGHLNRIKVHVESTSERAEKLGVAEVGEEELLGGFSGDTLDEDVTNTTEHQIQREEGLSLRPAGIQLPTTKPAEEEERNLEHTSECGSSLQEEEMLEHPELTKVDSLSEQKKELTKFSKEEKDKRQQMPNVNEDDLSALHLSSKNIHRNLNERQECCPERPVNSVIEDVMQPMEEQESLFDQSSNSATHTQNHTDKFDKTSNNRQTEMNGCDDEITLEKKQLDGTSKKTDHEFEGDDTITAITEAEDSILETKNTDSRSSMHSRSQAKQRTSKETKELKEKLRAKIESMRPTVSANKKYPAAFNTPIIYDQNVSYEPEYHSLLPVVEEQLTLLLVVTLLGCGEINLQRSKGKTPGTLTEINCYFAMVAWLLSLGGAYNSDVCAPFSIIGMQQAYQNGKLQLFVGVQPNRAVFDVNAPAPGKGSRKNKISAFNKAISKYLSTRSLRSVYQDMGRVYLGGSYLVDENHYSSKMLSTCITVGQDPNAVQRVFESKPGFFWETLDIADTNEVFQDGSCGDFTPENTIVLVQASLYHRPSCILDLLCRIEDEGCDLAGLRLAYGDVYEANKATSFETSKQHGITQSREYLCPRHTLALAVRGPSAISKIKNVIGAKLPILDEPGNVPSLRSLYCSTMSEDKLFYCPSYSNQAAVNLARWFGGRLSEKDLTNMEAVDCEITTKVDSPLSDGVPVQKPPALLVSSTQIAFYLITSPLVPPSFLGHVLHVCDVRGFSLHGIRRMHLSKRQGNNLGLSQLQQAAFCPLAGNSSFSSPNESPPGSPVRGKVTFNFESALVSSRPGKAYPSTVIVLQRENGIYHAATLVKHLSESLGEWKKNNLIDLPHSEGNPWRLYFCTLQFCEANCKFLWGDVGRGPDISILKLARIHCFASNPELEQVCVLSAVGDKAIQYIGLLLKILYSADNPVSGYWELLAIKSFTHLSLIQAREVTPIEVGEPTWQSSVQRLMSTAVFVCVLRGINIIQRLREFLASLTKMSTAQRRISDCVRLDWWTSQTTEVAFRQIAVLFEENELFCDETNRANTKYVPPPRQKISRNFKSESKVLHSKQRKRLQKQAEYKNNNTDDSSTSVETCQFSELPIIQSLLAGPRPITTVALIKPSCLLNTKKLGKIFKSVCQENFDIVGLRMSVLTRNEAEVLIRNDDPDVNENVDYLTSSASVLMCLQRENAVKKLLDILGPEDPIIARSLDPFLLRGSYGVDSIHNSMHGSETYCAALCEIRMLFPCGLCCDQTIDLEAEQISCRAYDETIGKHKERKLIKRSITATGMAQSLASSLVQVNCLVLTHRIAYERYGRKRIAFVDVLERLLSTSFIPVGMKMALLSEEQTDSCLNLVGLKSEKRQQLKNELTEGPCIVIALQRDNAVTCFDTIIESAQAKCRSLGEYQKHILQGRTEEEAKDLLLFFFDVLLPNCVDEICAI